MTRVVLDAAGGPIGGAARWRHELDSFTADTAGSVAVIGRGRRLTGGWLLSRERLAAGTETVVASNNASFALAGRHRRVVLHNAMHFLYPEEARRLHRLAAPLYPQVHLVRRLCGRADLLVVPCSAMAARVVHHLPATRGRIAVRHHPVTSVGQRRATEQSFILTPVLPAPYKNLDAQLRLLLRALHRTGSAHRVVVTAKPSDLPPDITGDPRVTCIGTVPHSWLAAYWRSATAAFFPSVLEAFGYPLAEARAYGVPVLAPDSEQTREIAGGALRPYQLDHVDSLCGALEGVVEAVVADPDPFDRTSYFEWLLGLDQAPRVAPGAGA